MSKYLGIDFGTTNSVCAISENGRSTVLKIEDNYQKEMLKSVIYVNPKHEMVVGKEAVRRYLWDVENLPATPPKRITTGKMYKIVKNSTYGGFAGMIDVPEIIEVDTSGRGRLLQSLKSVLGNDSYTGTNIFNKYYALEDLLVILIKELKNRSEQIAGEELNKVIIGRPVRYVGNNPSEKLAVKRMERIAKRVGFSAAKLEYEPVGAALDFGIDIKKELTVLVFDFGGGTLDVCIMRFPTQEILAVSGRSIGGDLLNTEIFKNNLLHYFGANTTFNQGNMEMPRHLMSALENWYSISQLKTMRNIDSLENLISKADQPQPVKNLRELILSDSGFNIYQKIDQAKISLSTKEKAHITFPSKSYTIDETISRKRFEHLIEPYLKETKRMLDEVIKTAGLTKEELDTVIATGGSSNIPSFRNLLVTYFGSQKIRFGENFTRVASGLALRSEQVFSAKL
ncbi:Hsp70 family protein [Patescibacteria group bacterium]|nr:Hsp70 family protein [Patescibacteria group bacterium]